MLEALHKKDELHLWLISASRCFTFVEVGVHVSFRMLFCRWIVGLASSGNHACELQCYEECDKGLDDCKLCAIDPWAEGLGSRRLACLQEACLRS